MEPSDPLVVLVTGASSGIGKACATRLAALGHRVYGASRSAPEPEAPFRALSMDVTDDRSVAEGVRGVIEKEGRLDAVVNGAGVGLAGAIEDTDIDEAKGQFETNFFGAFRVCRAALPLMRERRRGTIVNISSIAGLIAIPFQSVYSASKFALEGFTEALRIEVSEFGIRVALVEPGDFRTNFTRNRVRARKSSLNPAYREALERALAMMERDEMNGPDPERVAGLVARLIGKRSFRLRNLVGRVDQRMAVWLKRILPGGLFERILRKNYGC